MRYLKERIGELLRQLASMEYPQRLEITGWRENNRCFPITDEISLLEEGWERARLNQGSGTHLGLAVTVTVPESMDQLPLELAVATGHEGEWDATNPQMAAYVNGKLRQGLDVNHRRIYLTDCAKAGETFEIFLSVYTGEAGSIREWKSELLALDEKVRTLYYDLLVPWQALELMDAGSREYEELLQLLNRAVNFLDFRCGYSESFLESVEGAEEALQDGIRKLPKTRETAVSIGHTHIDVAWRWTLAVTEEKAARSFSTVLALMERYPDYIFMSSQPQLYLYVKKNQPALYERIRERIKEGRWEPEGGMFLEADCNLTSGESLVRQFLYGKKFFREEFGVDNRILWLPDVFGYSAALPQIMEKCGIDSFMTTKISWNETNAIPFDTFWWEGIDGTKILTHFITTKDYQKDFEISRDFNTTYNGTITPSQVKGAWQRYQQKGQNDEVLIAYGFGDGGGGPTEEMLETARRLKNGDFGIPAVRQEKAGAFFDRLHKKAEEVCFPTWAGELYLEYHRGTYTSMAANKKGNRKGEFALQNAETWSVLAGEYAGMAYPVGELSEGWEILMRNQFHDILPGSSIREVYEDSAKEYARLQALTSGIQERMLQALSGKIQAETGDVIVFNPTGSVLDHIAEVPKEALPKEWCRKGCVPVMQPLSGGLPALTQRAANGNLIFTAESVPGKGWKTYRLSEKEEGYEDGILFADDGHVTTTPWHRLTWNEAGQLTSFYDVEADRELIRPGQCANVLMTSEDKPHNYDNWNIYEYYKEKQWPVEKLISRRVTEKGPVRMAIELKWEYLASQITETFYFYADTPRIDIQAHVDWQQDQVLLKAMFPLDLNTREGTFEIQYGNVKRTTTANTSWEQARFEVCCQKWMDLSEYDYGVSFLNDCKYGVSVEENVVGLTLLKSGRMPNPVADRGIHDFTYSILPHKGSWQEAGTVQEAYSLNNPAQVSVKENDGGTLPALYGHAEADRQNVIVEVLKKAEDGDAAVLRLYECQNRRTRTRLKLGEVYGRISVSDMLETPERVLAENTDCCELELKPFEILTLRLEK